MEFAIKPEEILPTAEIRPLSDVEIDHVEGGARVPPTPPGPCFPRRPDKEQVLF